MPISRLTPSYTLTEDRLAQLKEVVPEAFADGKINWEVLREVLGEHLEDEEQPTERFGLFWPGKREARRAAAMPPQGALLPAPGEGVNEDSTRNVFIEGENLEVLKLLRKAYAGKVKMIYIDPPYNTGNDFVYKDDYAEPVETYLRRTGQAGEQGELLTTNQRTSGRFHSNWLDMMYPRLVLAREFLREDGMIVISIDDNEIHNLRVVMNEVFGEENFVSQVTVLSNPRGRQAERFLATVHEYVLMYAKSSDTCNVGGIPLTEQQLREYKYQDSTGRKYRLLGLRQRGVAWRREDRPGMHFPLYVSPQAGSVSLDRSETHLVEVYPQRPDGQEGRWKWGRKKVARSLGDLEGRLVATRRKWDVFVRDYLRTKSGQRRTSKAKTLWQEKELNYQNGTEELKALFGGICPVEYPKPVALLRKLVSMIAAPEDICLDFFAGSCTTAQAVLQLNREDRGKCAFICVQLPEPVDGSSSAGRNALKLGLANIAEIGKERIRRVIARVREEREGQLPLQPHDQPEDLGFRVYKLGRSQPKRWQAQPGQSVQEVQTRFAQFESPLVEGWDPEALCVEVMLQEGFPLDSQVQRVGEVGSNAVYRISSEWCEHRIFLCLDSEMAEETIERLPRLMGDQDILVCLDNALTDEAKMRLDDRCNVHVI